MLKRTSVRAPQKRILPGGPGREGGVARKADRVARDLIGQIAGGALEVGSLLPKEAELATSYEVNRGVVREAVKLLEVHRLVRPVRRRGTVVLEPLHSMSPEVLVAMLVPRPGHVDRRALGSFLEVRASMDAEMIALAAERRTLADVRTMRGLLADLAEQVHDARAFSETVLRLPLVIARATKNPVFEMLAAFNRRVVSELEGMGIATRPPSVEHVDGLGVLVDFIEERDVEGARKLVTAFHAWSMPRILASAALSVGAPVPRSRPKQAKKKTTTATRDDDAARASGGATRGRS